MHKKTTHKLITAAFGVAASQSAQAAFFSADVSSAGLSSSTVTGGSIYLDFDSMSASMSSINEADLTIVSGTKPFENGQFSYVIANGGWKIPTEGMPGLPYFVRTPIKLAEGEPLNVIDRISPYGFLEFRGFGPWNSPNDGVGYFGITSTGPAQAWVKINYNDAANTLQLLAFGYNSDGAILAGQSSAIPEPASAAAMAALLAGGVAAFGRRQKRAA